MQPMRPKCDDVALSLAVPGLGLGLSAGAAVFWRKTLTGPALSKGTLGEKQGRVAYAKLRFRHLDVCLVSAYLSVGVGAAGTNVVLSGDIAATLLQLGMPFLIYSDWNLAPEELAATG